MEREKKRRYLERGFVAAVFLFVLLWAAVQPFNASPDEAMRYDIVEYLCEHGRLPHGGDPEIRNEIWGISYAFNPIVSYMLSALLVKIAGLFWDGGMAFILAARLVNVLFITGMAALVLRIGRELFDEKGKWLFSVLVMLLPGVLFVGSYINNDAMALFSTAWICYSWVRYLKEGWSIRNCIWLGVGLSLCLLSYYNAYGGILMSFLFFTFTALFCEGKAWNVSFWLKRGLIVAGVTAVLSGWWFVRNALLYDGDVLGMKTSSAYAEKYASAGYKPSERVTPKSQGMSPWEMLWYVPGNWIHNWLITVLVSFVGTFGYMTVFMPYGMSKCYFLIYLLGAVGICFTLRMFGFRKKQYFSGRASFAGGSVRLKTVAVSREWDKQRIFHVAMLGAMAVPPVLLMIYAWASDFQGQGRYLLPMVLPLMYFIVRGYESLTGRLLKGEKARRAVYLAVAAALVLMAFYTFGFVFLPSCRS